ncbi:hypothetical protein [Streptomyces sp. NPDC006879]|uniref:hypothetical protein n=1 Tax=Streptomyces sp. NPDC006879 TaxID=3364767 RepID=UPI003695EBB7
MHTTAQLDHRPTHPDWERSGSVLLSRHLGADRVAALATQAHQQIDTAVPYSPDEVGPHRDGSFTSPVRYGLLPAGPLLTQLAHDASLLRAVRESTGLPGLVPRGCSVAVYRYGDFHGLHTDAAEVKVTVCVALTADLPPLWWAPSLRDAAPEALAGVVADSGFWPECAHFERLEHPLTDGGVHALAGSRVPHWRTPFTGEEPGLLASITYAQASPSGS